jgi:hypothetical protein
MEQMNFFEKADEAVKQFRAAVQQFSDAVDTMRAATEELETDDDPGQAIDYDNGNRLIYVSAGCYTALELGRSFKCVQAPEGLNPFRISALVKGLRRCVTYPESYLREPAGIAVWKLANGQETSSKAYDKEQVMLITKEAKRLGLINNRDYELPERVR